MRFPSQVIFAASAATICFGLAGYEQATGSVVALREPPVQPDQWGAAPPTPEPEPMPVPALAIEPLPISAINDLIGQGSGAPGSLLEPYFHLDPSEDRLSVARARLSAFRAAFGGQVDIDVADAPDKVTVTFLNAENLPSQLVGRWGKPALRSDSGEAWAKDGAVWNTTSGQRIRVLYDTDADAPQRATLTWERYQTVSDLIAPERPTTFGFEDRPLLGAELDDRDADLNGRLPPLLDSPIDAPPSYELEVDASNRIIGVTLTVPFGQSVTGTQIQGLMIDKLGRPRREGDLLVWERKKIVIDLALLHNSAILSMERTE